MARDAERAARSREEPVVGGLPNVPGILAAIQLTPGIGLHLRGLADELLVKDFPGATLTRAEREMLATAVSAANDCFYCMDSHGAFATSLLEQSGATRVTSLIDGIKCGAADADTQLAVLIAAAFSMYNRIVDGFRAKTPPTADAYRARAGEIAAQGYSDRRVTAVPG
jgi:AhpD family alkylhydroperoxidase